MIAARVENREALANLLQFGQRTNQKRRVGMLLELGTSVGLETDGNVSFLIGARLDDGGKQFLCPTVGKLKVKVQIINWIFNLL